MTPEERLDRIEHITGTLVGEFKKDREENRQLWRGTQRQLGELSARTTDIARSVNDLAIATRDRISELTERMDATDRRILALGKKTDERIAALVTAVGALLKRNGR